MKTKDVLKLLRKSRGFSAMQDFCSATGVNFSTYQNYESGKRMPTADVLIKLADFYGVTPDYLLGRGGEEQELMEELKSKFNMSALESIIVREYLSLPPSMRENVMGFLEKAVQRVMDEGGGA